MHTCPHSSWCFLPAYLFIPLRLFPNQLANMQSCRSTGVPKSSTPLQTKELIPLSRMTGHYSRSWRCPTARIRTITPSSFILDSRPSYRRQPIRDLYYSPLTQFYTDQPRNFRISRFIGKRPPPSPLPRSSVSRVLGRSTRIFSYIGRRT